MLHDYVGTVDDVEGLQAALDAKADDAEITTINTKIDYLEAIATLVALTL